MKKKNQILATATLLFLAAAFMSGTASKFLICAAILVMLGAADWRCLMETGPLRFWLFPSIFIFIIPFFAGEKTLSLAGHAYSGPQFLTGIGFLFNAYCFICITAFTSRNYTLNEAAALADRAGIKNLGLRAALALCALRILKNDIAASWEIFDAERPGFRAKALEFHTFAGMAVRNAALTAERIAVLFFLRNIRI